MLQRRQRRRPGAAVVPGDQHDICLGLGNTGSDGAHAHFGNQLDVDTRLRVGVLEIVDELLEVLDRIDVVVGRRADEPDAGCRVACLGDPRPDLRTRQLATLAGLRALGHLDLQIVGVHQILRGDAEAPRGDLLDGRPPQISVGIGDIALRILAALAGIGLAADAVHGDRQRLMRFRRNRAVAHRSGGESLHDR